MSGKGIQALLTENQNPLKQKKPRAEEKKEDKGTIKRKPRKIDTPIQKTSLDLTKDSLDELKGKQPSVNDLSFGPSQLGADEITNKELQKVGTGLKNVPGLTSLSIDITYCSEITNTGLKGLCKGFKHLVGLENLTMDFYKCWGVTDAGLKILGDAIKDLKALQSCFLSCYRCDHFSGKAVTNVAQGLKSCTALKSLDLNFRSCHAVDDASLIALAKSLEQLTSLESLDVNVQFTAVTKEGVGAFKKILKVLPKLDINIEYEDPTDF